MNIDSSVLKQLGFSKPKPAAHKHYVSRPQPKLALYHNVPRGALFVPLRVVQHTANFSHVHDALPIGKAETEAFMKGAQFELVRDGNGVYINKGWCAVPFQHRQDGAWKGITAPDEVFAPTAVVLWLPRKCEFMIDDLTGEKVFANYYA